MDTVFERYPSILPLSAAENRKSENKRGENDTFRDIFTIAMLFGLGVSPSDLKMKKNKVSKWNKVWYLLVTFLRTILTIIFCMYSYLLLPSTATRVTCYAYAIFGYLNHLTVIKNSRKIVAAIKKVSSLTSELGFKTNVRKSTIKLHIFILFVGVIALMSVEIIFFYFQNWDNAVEKIKKYAPFTQGSRFEYYFVWLIVFSTLYSFNMASATSYLILLICSNAYQTTGNLFISFGKSIKRDLDVIEPVCNTISKHTVVFKLIITRLNEIDACLNACAFLIYATMISSFFNTVSVVLSESQSYDTFVVYIYIGGTFILALASFLILTFSGASVVEKSNSLREELIDISVKIIKKTPDVPSVLMFNILFENIKVSKNYVTGLGLFNITKSFILTVSGMMITYGVLIYQMGTTKGA